MAVIRSVNPWSKAGGMEPQRSDLWILNLEKVLNAVRALPQFENLDLPETRTTRYFARSVVFPEVQIASYESKRHSIPITNPGYDEQVGGVRVDFLVDAWIMTSNPQQPVQDQRNSRIYNLLRAWHQMARVGRTMRSSLDDQFSIPLEPTARSYASFYKFDVLVQMFSGSTLNPFQTAEDVDSFLSTSEGLELTSTYALKRCWVSGLQLGNLDHAQNGFFTVSATLVPEAITPFDGVTLGATTVAT